MRQTMSKDFMTELEFICCPGEKASFHAMPTMPASLLDLATFRLN